MFLTAVEKLNAVPSRCVGFEDAVVGVETAKAGGMKCAVVTFVGHHAADKLRATGADIVVASLAEVTVAQIAARVG